MLNIIQMPPLVQSDNLFLFICMETSNMMKIISLINSLSFWQYIEKTYHEAWGHTTNNRIKTKLNFYNTRFRPRLNPTSYTADKNWDDY